MVRLSKVVSSSKGAKADGDKALTQVYQAIQKTASFDGMVRSLNLDDVNEQPTDPDITIVQNKVTTLIEEVIPTLISMVDTVASNDYGNASKKADLVIDGVTLVEGAPITFYIYLGKRALDWKTVVSKLPTLDPAEEWTYDPNQGAYVSAVKTTPKTKKITQVLQLAAATEHHAAQVSTIQEDVRVGLYKTKKFSGAIPNDVKNQLMKKVVKLENAIKEAIAEINSSMVEEIKVGNSIYDYLTTPLG
jgi:hypothetical protein